MEIKLDILPVGISFLTRLRLPLLLLPPHAVGQHQVHSPALPLPLLQLPQVSPGQGVPALILALPLLLLLLLLVILRGCAEVGLREAGVQGGQRGGLLEEPGRVAPAHIRKIVRPNNGLADYL
jgi:hypothetical protein